MAELVDAQDLKSCDFGHAGSIPALGIVFAGIVVESDQERAINGY